jgi:hypothetical protein
MADKKISQLTGATTPLAGTEVLPVVQSGSTVKVSIDNVTKGRVVNGLSFDTDVAAAGVTLSGTTLEADGTDANIDVFVKAKAAGSLDLRYGVGSNIKVGKTSSFTGAETAQIVFHEGSTQLAQLKWDPAGNTYVIENKTFNAPISFRTYNGVERMKVNGTSGDVEIATHNVKIATAGKGIDFSANTGAAGMTSELLDWYEEGDWTPLISDGTNNATMGSDNRGYYTRIGRQVFFTAQVAVQTIGSVGADAGIYGLPFTSVNSTATRSGIAVGFASSLNISAGQVVTGYVEINSTKIELMVWDAATGTTSMSGTEISDGGTLFISGQYTTN